MGSVCKKNWAAVAESSGSSASANDGYDEAFWLRQWAFGTSSTGIGLSSIQFWSLTPKEFQALTKEWEKHREFECSLYAGLQATLHNAHFKRDDGQGWSPAMFMPGYKPRVQTWQEQLQRAKLRERQGQRVDIKERRRVHEQHQAAKSEFEAKQKLVEEARARGATREELKAIMRG